MKKWYAIMCLVLLITGISISAGVDVINSTDVYSEINTLNILDFKVVTGFSLSPDDTRALFSTIEISLAKTSPMEIYSVDPKAGTKITILDGTGPDWSPDGKQIAYLSNDEHVDSYTDEKTGKSVFPNNNIYIKYENGSTSKITNDDQSKETLRWSPDNKKIAYSVSSFGFQYIYVVDSDGKNPTKITNKSFDPSYSPIWSPDGKKITFYSNSTGNGDIYSMNADGSQIKQLTNGPEYETPLDWSHDGKKILYKSFLRDSDSSNSEVNLCLMNSDGTGKEILLKTKSVVYARFSSKDNVIYYIGQDEQNIKITKIEIERW